MAVAEIGNATIEKVEEICGAGFKPRACSPKFDQEAFDAQKSWMVPEHVEPAATGWSARFTPGWSRPAATPS
jgi:hypothetical protein